MERRSFFKWAASSAAAAFVFPRALLARFSPPEPVDPARLRQLAGVVLPASLGPERLERAVRKFEQWVREYRAGVEMSAGYGVTRLRTVGPDPSVGYAGQLEALEAAAKARGAGSFAALDAASKAVLVTEALAKSGVNALPRRPDGGHVAADLMSHFFFIDDDGHDWLYAAAIGRAACRGLGSSAARPSSLKQEA